MSHIYIRSLDENDYEQVANLDRASRASFYHFNVRDMLDAENYAHGIFVDNILVGYCTIGGAEEITYADDYEYSDTYGDEALLLGDVCVLPEYRGNGYASSLVGEVRSKQNPNKSVFLDILDDRLSYFFGRLDFQLLEDGLMVKEKHNCNKQSLSNLIHSASQKQQETSETKNNHSDIER